MKIRIDSSVVRHYLKNAYFITGTAYAGKSTMVRMLAEKYDMIECGENYHMAVSRQVASPDTHPASSYFDTMSGWEEFVTRTPDEYEKWVTDGAWEFAEFEIAELIRLSASGKKIIVDTNIPLEVLKEIVPWNHVAVMLSPQSASVERFFDRSDPEKQFLLGVIENCPDPQAAMENFRACIARVNSPQVHERLEQSGFFVLRRTDFETDTKEEMLERLAHHFELSL